MNGDSRIEQFNQAVRAVVVLALVAGLIYGFVVSKVVNTESFLIIANTAFIWWFKSRDEKNATGARTPPAAPTPAPAPPTP